MQEVQFVFNGGLGNQIFQYFASKYISRNFNNLNLSYALSKHILNGYRNYELDELIKEPIKISKEFSQYGEKIYSKLIKNLPILNKSNKII